MVERKRKPAVRPELARKWLQRNEEGGESPPQIAQADGYDVRTVRKQLGVMRQEREIREARQAVLRQALEKHYIDICAFTERLRAETSGRAPSILPVSTREDPMWGALRQHLPRTPLWKNIDKLEKLVDPFTLSLNIIEARIRKEAMSRTSLDFVSSADIIGLNDGLPMSILFHLRESARGAQGMKGINYVRTTRKTGIHIQHGSYGIALVPEDKAADVETTSRNLMEEALQWQDYNELCKLTQDFVRTQQNVKEELTRTILRRVLPGKCIYCPF